ncbi:diacylglycerol kinase catalytic region [Microbacterium sp. HM58-2]|nr:diacylglycerol kinase catalytic region [Microbacterium sp. HM58-2]
MTTIVEGARVRVVGTQRTGVVKRVERDTTRVIWDEGSCHNPNVAAAWVATAKLSPVAGLGDNVFEQVGTFHTEADGTITPDAVTR